MKMRLVQSIKGKILLMGGVAIAASVILGSGGITALNKNSRNNEVLKEINAINVAQSENQSLETSYLYFLDDSYLEKIVKNLSDMENDSKAAKKSASILEKKKLDTVAETIGECKDNYSQIRELASQRGYTSDVGEYQKFIANDEDLANTFAAVKDDQSWLDGSWSSISGGGQTIKIDGKTYTKFVYKGKIPEGGKRDYLVARIGGNGAGYAGKVYFSNISFQKGSKKEKIDLSKVTDEDISGSYGDALKDQKITDFNKGKAIYFNSKFTASNAKWEEVSIKLPITSYAMQDYSTVTFEAYLEKGNYAELSLAAAFSDKYDFSGTFASINDNFATYSKHVMEGNDVADEAKALEAQFKEMTDNIPLYIFDKGQQSDVSSKLADKQSQFEAMNKVDEQVLKLKKENITLADNLTKTTATVQKEVEKDTSASRTRLTAIMIFVLFLSAGILIMLTLLISRTMNESIKNFKNTLQQMTEGNLTVRAAANGKDEFSAFGAYVNQFLERLSEVIKSAQKISKHVKKSGNELDVMAKNSNMTSGEIGSAVEEISKGATNQASEVDVASTQISKMGDVFAEIVADVDQLGEMAEQMQQVSVESTQFMEELGSANSRTTEAFAQVAQQTHTTNESVQKIREATELITSIASQTNLLSLNASIEAAGSRAKGKAKGKDRMIPPKANAARPNCWVDTELLKAAWTRGKGNVRSPWPLREKYVIIPYWTEAAGQPKNRRNRKPTLNSSRPCNAPSIWATCRQAFSVCSESGCTQRWTGGASFNASSKTVRTATPHGPLRTAAIFTRASTSLRGRSPVSPILCSPWTAPVPWTTPFLKCSAPSCPVFWKATTRF